MKKIALVVGGLIAMTSTAVWAGPVGTTVAATAKVTITNECAVSLEAEPDMTLRLSDAKEWAKVAGFKLTGCAGSVWLKAKGADAAGYGTMTSGDDKAGYTLGGGKDAKWVEQDGTQYLVSSGLTDGEQVLYSANLRDVGEGLPTKAGTWTISVEGGAWAD